MKAGVTKRVIAKATRVASNDDGNGDGGKSNGDGNKGAGLATTRVVAAATTVAGEKGNCNVGNEGGKQQRG